MPCPYSAACTASHWRLFTSRSCRDFLECGGLTPLSYGEARLASEEQRLSLLRVLSFLFFTTGNLAHPCLPSPLPWRISRRVPLRSSFPRATLEVENFRMELEIESVRGRTLPEWLPIKPPAPTKFYSQHPESKISAKFKKTNGLIFSTRSTFAFWASRTVLRDALLHSTVLCEIGPACPGQPKGS